jgi:hypothetical protein
MKTEFVYQYRGEDCIWEVVKQFGNGWLCKVTSGQYAGEQANFQWETVRFGQLRLREIRLAGGAAVC